MKQLQAEQRERDRISSLIYMAEMQERERRGISVFDPRRVELTPLSDWVN